MAKPSGGAFVGIDIGSQTIKVVEARGAGPNLQITALGMENTPPGAVQGGMVADPKALGTTLKALLAKSGVGAKRSVSAAAGSSVIVRVIEVPRMSPGELAETMKWEVERHIPFAANDVEMSYQPIDDPAAEADPNNPNMEVLLAVAQRDMVAAHVETLQAAGLNPVAIDVEPLATGRTLLNLGQNELAAKNVVVVNIGATNTDVSVFKNGTLRFPRTIPLAGDNFTRAIADHLGISMEAAEDEKREHATIFMDMIGGGAPDFGLGPERDEPAAPGRTPFDFPDVPSNTPFAEPAPAPDPSPFNLDDTPPAPAPGPPTFDMDDEPVGIGGAPPAARTYDDNPFATPPADPEPSPFATSATDAASPFATAPAGPPAPVPDDPRARRRREIFDAILPVLGEFVTELRRSIDYFRSRYPNDNLDQIILCGGSARIPNLDQFVQSDLMIPTAIADPFGQAAVSSKQMSGERLADLAPAFTVAVGLATRDAVLGSERK